MSTHSTRITRLAEGGFWWRTVRDLLWQTGVVVVVAEMVWWGAVVVEASMWLPRGGRGVIVFLVCGAVIVSIVRVVRVVWRYRGLGRGQRALLFATQEGGNELSCAVVALATGAHTGNPHLARQVVLLHERAAEPALSRALQRVRTQALFSVVAFLFISVAGWYALLKSPFSEAGVRLLTFWKEYVPPAPFGAELLSPHYAWHGHPYTVLVRLEGRLPANPHLLIDSGTKVPLVATPSPSTYSVTIHPEGDTLGLQVCSGRHCVPVSPVAVLPQPQIHISNITLRYPTYLRTIWGREKTLTERIPSLLEVPEGTTIQMRISLQKADSLLVAGPATYRQQDNTIIWVADTSVRVQLYAVSGGNVYPYPYTMQVKVIEDLPPSISGRIEADTPTVSKLSCAVEIFDDYGFSWLAIVLSTDRDTLHHRIPIRIRTQPPYQRLEFQLASEGLWQVVAGATYLVAYLEVADNNMVSGPQVARTPPVLFVLGDVQQLSERLVKEVQALARQAQQAEAGNSPLDENLERLREYLLLTGQVPQTALTTIRELLMREDTLAQQVAGRLQKIKEQLQALLTRSPTDSALRERYEEMLKAIDESIPRSLLQKLQELLAKLEELRGEELERQLQAIQLQRQLMQLSLERIENLLKRLEVERALRQSAQELDSLIHAQERAIRLPVDTPSLSVLQKHILEKLQEVERELRGADSLNNTLTPPVEFDLPEHELNTAREHLRQALEHLSRRNESMLRHSQRQALQRLKQIREQIADALEAIQQAETASIEEVRKALDAALDISQTLEEHLGQKADLLTLQLILGAVHTLNDTIQALASTTPRLGKMVMEEALAGKQHLQEAIKAQQLGQNQQASYHLHKSLAAINKTALLLSEALQNMVEQLSRQNASAAGVCPNPNMGSTGSNRPQDVESIARGLEQLIQKLNSNTSRPQGSQQQNSKQQEQAPGNELIQLAKEQYLLRQSLEKIRQSLSATERHQAKELHNIIQEMKQLERQLLEGTIAEHEVVRRLEQLRIRLLEVDRSIHQQRMDQKRQAERPDQPTYGNPPATLSLPAPLPSSPVPIHPTHLPPTLPPPYQPLFIRYLQTLNP